MPNKTRNEHEIIGFLGNEPKVFQKEGKPVVANISVATHEGVKTSEGNYEFETEWHDVTLFGTHAALVEKLEKGAYIFVSGPSITEKWQDKNGQEKSKKVIKARTFILLDRDEHDKENSNHIEAETK